MNKSEYHLYKVKLNRKMLHILKAIVIVMVIGDLFYESMLACIFLFPIGIIVYRSEMRKEVKRMKWKLNLQFQDALAGITAALSAGYSIENSITEALADLKCMYREKDLIIEQFQRIENRIRLNTTIEVAFLEFAKECDIEDIKNFAWTLYTVKRTGGDLAKIAKSTSTMISERIDVNREIQTVITGKQLESQIMGFVPAAIIVYLKYGCSGFLDPLYQNVVGNLIMTGVLIVYLLAYMLSRKIVSIEV